MDWTKTRTERAWRAMAAAMVLIAGALHTPPADAAPTPTASAVTGGSYTVSYSPCGCLMDWLEERIDGGPWSYVGQGGAIAFANKPVGTYYYRVGNWMGDYFWGWNEYSAEIMVTVAPAGSPADPLSTQLLYRYDTRYGDGNGDGWPDLFVKRVAGGSAGNGSIDTIMLLQTGGGRFTSIVPSANLASAASAWPAAAVQVVLEDFNVDGFADLLIKGLGNTIGGALNEIVYAPGRPGALQPLGVRAVDPGLKRFLANSRDYFADTGYFDQNAPVNYVVIPIYYYSCLPGFYDYTYGYAYGYCGYFTYWYAVTYRDYSGFDSTAVSTASTEASIEAQSTSREQGVATIAQGYEAVLGAPIGGRDPSGLNGERARLDDPTYRKGFDLFMAVLGIHDAQADELDPPRNPRRQPDIVYVTGRRVLGFLPLHTALEYGGSTLSAFDSDESLMGNGVLVSRPNAMSDRPPMMMTLGTVASSLGAAAYWSSLVASDARYPDNLPYNPVPSTGGG
ncbi:MAG TPA: VCBS repeat-containing protein, partial [Gammaproteobacteria bacterium]|nr:VCBS repeat-containing protein [Gammaproteobacteria bacterium]